MARRMCLGLAWRGSRGPFVWVVVRHVGPGAGLVQLEQGDCMEKPPCRLCYNGDGELTLHTAAPVARYALHAWPCGVLCALAFVDLRRWPLHAAMRPSSGVSSRSSRSSASGSQCSSMGSTCRPWLGLGLGSGFVTVTLTRTRA